MTARCEAMSMITLFLGTLTLFLAIVEPRDDHIASDDVGRGVGAIALPAF
jgi:hypothetical protein